LVESVSETVRMDEHGRLVIPEHLRGILGLSKGGRVTIKLEGAKLVLEPHPEGLEDRVREWASMTMSQSSRAATGDTRESWKWMSHEYARKKLGLT